MLFLKTGDLPKVHRVQTFFEEGGGEGIWNIDYLLLVVDCLQFLLGHPDLALFVLASLARSHLARLRKEDL